MQTFNVGKCLTFVFGKTIFASTNQHKKTKNMKQKFPNGNTPRQRYAGTQFTLTDVSARKLMTYRKRIHDAGIRFTSEGDTKRTTFKFRNTDDLNRGIELTTRAI